MTGRGRLSETIAKFNDKATNQEKSLNKNPFSETYTPERHRLTDDRYGRPVAGSKTEKRGIRAGHYVFREIIFLCEIIHKFGRETVGADGEPQVEIKFGYLFEIYATYSDKVVGMLIRARKHGLVAFEGEMLYQRQDDHKIITMLKPLDEIKASFVQSNDPVHCIASTS